MEVKQIEQMTEKLKERLVDPGKAAAFLGVSRQKLANDRWTSTGCPYYREGRKILYDIRDLKVYKKSRLQRIIPHGWTGE